MKLIIVHDDPKVYMGRKWCLEAESNRFSIETQRITLIIAIE